MLSSSHHPFSILRGSECGLCGLGFLIDQYIWSQSYYHYAVISARRQYFSSNTVDLGGVMRLLLLPITSERSLIYCQKLKSPPVRSKPRLDERIASKGSRLWDNFEKSDKKWKQTIVRWTSKLLDTVPFEENGLKTIPPRNTYMRKLESTSSHISEKHAIQQELTHKLEPIDLVYPSTARGFTDFDSSLKVIDRSVKTASQAHKKQILYCVLGLPLTIPFAINPLMPNFPGFYLIYRIWCNWRALRAAAHLQFLMKHKHLRPAESRELNEAYEKHWTSQQMTKELAASLEKVFQDEHLKRELDQAIRQTKPNHAPAAKKAENQNQNMKNKNENENENIEKEKVDKL